MAGVMVTRQLVNHNIGQRDNITPPSTAVISTGQRRPLTTSTAIYPSSITVIYISTTTSATNINPFIVYATRFFGL